jgi:hypothetical protein
VSGSSSTIVGNLEKGDYTIASFTVSQQGAGGMSGDASSGPSGNTAASAAPTSTNSTASEDLKVLIEYTDSAGQRNMVEKSVELSQSSSATAVTGPGAQNQSSSSSSYTYIALAAVVLASGYVVYHRRKHGENPAIVNKLVSLLHRGKKKEGN